MRLPEILETVTSVYRANWRTIVALTALLTTPAYLLSVLVARALVPLVERLAPIDPLAPRAPPDVGLLGDLGTAFALGFTTVAIDQLAICLVAAALSLAVGRPGEPARPFSAVVTALLPLLARLLPMVAVVLLALLGLVAGWAVLQVPLALAVGPAASGGAGAFLALVAAVGVVAAAVFLLVRWSLASPVVALEGVGPIVSLGRSWQLVRGWTWRVLGYGLLIGLVAVILDLTLVQSVAAVVSLVAPAGVTAVEIGVGAVAQVLLVPLGALTSLVLYHDLRARPRSAMRGL